MTVPIKDFAFLESPPASDFNRYFMQQEFVQKPSDESVVNSTTNQDDDHLLFTPRLNTDYWITMFLIYDALAAADLKISWTVPTGSTWDYVSDAIGSAATTSSVFDVSRSYQFAPAGGTPTPGGVGSGSNVMALIKGLFQNGPNVGNFALRWAQGTASATATRVRARSCLVARRLTT